MKKMLKIVAAVVVAVAICISLPLNAQLTACSEGSHCPTGFYCDEGTHFCLKCIHCEELKRETLTPQDSCIMSVVDCGPCFEGLIEDLRLDRACVLPTEKFDSKSWPIILGVSISVTICFIVAIICLVFKKPILRPYILRIHTSLRTTQNKPSADCTTPPITPSSSASAQQGNPMVDPQSAPSAPTSYDPLRARLNRPYPDVPTVWPTPLVNQSSIIPGANTQLDNPSGVDQSSAPSAPPPYDQLYQPRVPAKSPTSGLRRCENSDNQVAQVYSNPNYVRLPQNIPSTEEEEVEYPLLNHSEDQNVSYGVGNNIDNEGDQFLPHNEDTMESNWIPNQTLAVANEQVNEPASAVPPPPVAAPAATARVRPAAAGSGPPEKVARGEESSNNHEGDSNNNRGGAPTMMASQVVINVLTINNNEQHYNNHRNREHRNNINLP